MQARFQPMQQQPRALPTRNPQSMQQATSNMQNTQNQQRPFSGYPNTGAGNIGMPSRGMNGPANGGSPQVPMSPAAPGPAAATPQRRPDAGAASPAPSQLQFETPVKDAARRNSALSTPQLFNVNNGQATPGKPGMQMSNVPTPQGRGNLILPLQSRGEKCRSPSDAGSPMSMSTTPSTGRSMGPTGSIKGKDYIGKGAGSPGSNGMTMGATNSIRDQIANSPAGMAMGHQNSLGGSSPDRMTSSRSITGSRSPILIRSEYHKSFAEAKLPKKFFKHLSKSLNGGQLPTRRDMGRTRSEWKKRESTEVENIWDDSEEEGVAV